MASIYDAAGQVFGRFGSGGETWPRGKQIVARLSQFIFLLTIGATEFHTKPRKKLPKTSTTSKVI